MTKKRSVCNFCSSFGHKEKFCYRKTANVMWHPMMPINCRGYDGFVLSDGHLEEYRRMAMAAEKKS